jgi:hypothetical protein
MLQVSFCTRPVSYHRRVCGLCIPLSLLGNISLKTCSQKRSIVGGVVFYAVRVVSQEIRQLVLTRIFSLNTSSLHKSFLMKTFVTTFAYPTNYGVQSSYSEAKRRCAYQQFLRFLWNSTFQYLVHKRPQIVDISCQMNPAHIPVDFFKIRINIILTYTPRSSKVF